MNVATDTHDECSVVSQTQDRASPQTGAMARAWPWVSCTAVPCLSFPSEVRALHKLVRGLRSGQTRDPQWRVPTGMSSLTLFHDDRDHQADIKHPLTFRPHQSIALADVVLTHHAWQ